MIEISNLRKESCEGYTKLIVDINSDIERLDNENQIWVSVEDKYAYMLNDITYDCCLTLPVYMAMYYKTDLHIKGKVSKKLYRNIVDYVSYILQSFSNELKLVNIYADGHEDIDNLQEVNATGISCGVDSLATVYKYYELEKDLDYKLTHLFFLNCGWHGSLDNSNTIPLFNKRALQAEDAANQIGLPLVKVDSNLHAFLYDLDDKASYFNLYYIIFAMGKGISKYYLSSSFSYEEVMKYGYRARNRDFSEYGDPMTLPLLSTPNTTIISDGCQYKRSQKTELIADWEVSKKYLNVCCRHSDDPNVDEKNCSECAKCNRTLIALDAMGKLTEYSKVFDLNKYKKNKRKILWQLAINYDKDAFSKDNYNFCEEKGMNLPSIRKVRILRRIKRMFCFK